MISDYSKLQFYSGDNTFKNTGVFSTSITMSGTLTASQERTFTSSVVLTENQVFVFAKAKYVDFTKGGSAVWQKMPTFDMNVPTTPFGEGINIGYLLTKLDGNTVTFIAGVKNAFASTETITAQTIDISYVTYTLAR